MNLTSPANNRAFGAVGALAAAMVLVALGGLAGYSSLQAEWMQLDAQRNELAVLSRPRPKPKAAQAKPITINPFLREENFALSANALQKRVVALIESSGGKLVSVGVDPPVTGDADLARRVTVQVSAELSNDALQKVLYSLESVPPYVFVENLSASVSDHTIGEKKQPQPAAAVAPNLVVTMSVVGYRRKAG